MIPEPFLRYYILFVKAIIFEMLNIDNNIITIVFMH